MTGNHESINKPRAGITERLNKHKGWRVLMVSLIALLGAQTIRPAQVDAYSPTSSTSAAADFPTYPSLKIQDLADPLLIPEIKEQPSLFLNKEAIAGFPYRQMTFLSEKKFEKAYPHIRFISSDAPDYLNGPLDPIFNVTLINDFLGLTQKEDITNIDIVVYLNRFQNPSNQPESAVRYYKDSNMLMINIPVEDLYNWLTEDNYLHLDRTDFARFIINERLNLGFLQGSLNLLEEKGYINSNQKEELMKEYLLVYQKTIPPPNMTAYTQEWFDGVYGANYNMRFILINEGWRDWFKDRLIPPSFSERVETEVSLLITKIKETLFGSNKPESTSVTNTKAVQISKADSEISLNDYPAPLDLGTALSLAVSRNPQWEKLLLPAISDHFLQTTVRWTMNENEQWEPYRNSYSDYIYLSENRSDNGQTLRVNRDFDGKVNYEPVEKETITLQDGNQITGYVVSREKAEPNEVGVLTKIWMTLPPSEGKPDLLAKKIGRFHVIADGTEALTVEPHNYSFEDPPGLFYYSKGSFFSILPVSFEKTLEVVFEDNGFDNPTPFWYRAEGVKLQKDLLSSSLPYKASWTDHPNLWEDYKRFYDQLRQLSTGVYKEKFTKTEEINLSPEEQFFNIDKTVNKDQQLGLSIQLEDWSMLDSCSITITYPNEETPAITGTIRQFLGITGVQEKILFDSRYASLHQEENGSLVFNLTSLPLPKDTRIVIQSSDQQKHAQVTLRSRPDQSLPQQRLRFIHRFLTMNSPAQEYVEADLELAKPMVIKQIQINLDGYKTLPLHPNSISYNLNLLPIEGNLYIVTHDGSLMPVSTGLEDLAEQAFYDVLIKPISDPLFRPGLPDNFFAYGSGGLRRPRIIRSNDPEKGWAFAANSTMTLVLRAGDKFRFDPFVEKGQQAANVSFVIWGWTSD